MTFEEGMKQSIEETEREKCELLGIIQEKDKAIAELVEKKTALEKCKFELEKENETLKMGLQYNSDNRDDILNENSDLQQKYLEESFEKSKLVKENAELKKANEWHKPSEKLPEECSLVLAYLFEETEPTICEYVVSNQWECLPKKIVFCSNDQVRLWQEIVLPKE